MNEAIAGLVVWQNDRGPQHIFTAKSPGFSTDGSDVVVMWLGGQHPPILNGVAQRPASKSSRLMGVKTKRTDRSNGASTERSVCETTKT